MIEEQEARASVQAQIDAMESRSGIAMAIVDGATKDLGWACVFLYNSRRFLETGNLSDRLAGNGPIVVEKQTGRTHKLVTARPIEDQLDELHRASTAEGRADLRGNDPQTGE